MAWIESHQSLSRHKKTLKTAGRLAVDRHKLIGHLHELWWWALDNVGVDGRLDGMSSYEIALAAQWDGDPKEFVDALIDGGFIDNIDGCLVLHDWYDYAGKLIERRLQERERSRIRREAAKRNRDVNQETTVGQPLDDQEKTNGTVPNLTVPNNTIDNININRRKKFDEDSIPMKIARHLQQEILKQDPNTKLPKDLQKWAEEADRMIRLDNRDPDEAMQLITWAQNDPFWKANILSIKKFREKYDTLKRQASRNTQSKPNTKNTALEMLRSELERDPFNIIDGKWSEL